MSDTNQKTHVIVFRFDRDPKVKLRGGARREPTTPTGTYRIWQPPPRNPPTQRFSPADPFQNPGTNPTPFNTPLVAY